MEHPTPGGRSKLRVYTRRYFVNLHNQPAAERQSLSKAGGRASGHARQPPQEALALGSRSVYTLVMRIAVSDKPPNPLSEKRKGARTHGAAVHPLSVGEGIEG